MDFAEDTFLIIARSLISSYAIFMSITLWSLTPKKRRQISIAILVFAAGWHTALAVMSTYILARGGPLSDPWWVATYGSAFLGSLCGLVWIMFAYRDRLEKVIRYSSQFRCNELCANHEIIVDALRDAAELVAEKAHYGSWVEQEVSVRGTKEDGNES